MTNRKWLKPLLGLVADPHFFEWITRKYRFFKRWQTQFPTLIFLLRRNMLFLRPILFKNAITPSLQKDNHLNQYVLFYLNQISLISSTAAGDNLDKTKFPYAPFPHKNLIKYESSYALSQMGLSRTMSIFRFSNQPTFHSSQTTKKKQIYLYNSYAGSDSLSAHPEILSVEDKFNAASKPHSISSKTPDLEITPELIRSRPSSDAVPQFMAISQCNHETTYLSGKTKPWTVTTGTVYKKELKLIQPKTESVQFLRSEYISPSFSFSNRELGISSEKHTPGLNFRQSTKQRIEGPFYNRVPDLHYYNPMKDSLKGLKKAALHNETKTDNFSVSHEVSDMTQKTKIDLNNLTDRVYRILERKIKIEKERRGLYG